MTAPGTPFESPRACPFVALDHDRDRRADKPDYNHRCFAEPTPAPRSIAHQEAYCLSPNFAACPVFQDWAVRAAARPIEGSGAGASDASAGAGAAAAAAMAAAAAEPDVDNDLADVEAESPESGTTGSAAAEPPAESALEQLPEDASMTAAGAEIAAAAAATTGVSPGVAAPPTFATTDWQSVGNDGEQLGVFDAHAEDAHSSYGEPDAGYPVAADETATPSPAFVPPPVRPESPRQAPSVEEEAAVAAAPAFLAARSPRPQPTTPQPGITRDELVPSWDVDGRYGAEPPPTQSGGGGSRLDGILTAIAVIAILALGVAAVIFLPGLLSKGGAKTPPPSSVIASNLPTVPASGLFSVPPSVGPSSLPTIGPSQQASQLPIGSPRLYKIKAGDSLAKIANRFGVTVQDILDANPDIANPDNIFVGQIIVVPVAVPAAT